MSDETAELVIDEERTYERADARWIRLHCDQGCIEIEARFAPADGADAFVEALHFAHFRLHAESVETEKGNNE